MNYNEIVEKIKQAISEKITGLQKPENLPSRKHVWKGEKVNLFAIKDNSEVAEVTQQALQFSSDILVILCELEKAFSHEHSPNDNWESHLQSLQRYGLENHEQEFSIYFANLLHKIKSTRYKHTETEKVLILLHTLQRWYTSNVNNEVWDQDDIKILMDLKRFDDELVNLIFNDFTIFISSKIDPTQLNFLVDIQELELNAVEKSTCYAILAFLYQITDSEKQDNLEKVLANLERSRDILLYAHEGSDFNPDATILQIAGDIQLAMQKQFEHKTTKLTPKLKYKYKDIAAKIAGSIQSINLNLETEDKNSFDKNYWLSIINIYIQRIRHFSLLIDLNKFSQDAESKSSFEFLKRSGDFITKLLFNERQRILAPVLEIISSSHPDLDASDQILFDPVAITLLTNVKFVDGDFIFYQEKSLSEMEKALAHMLMAYLLLNSEKSSEEKHKLISQHYSQAKELFSFAEGKSNHHLGEQEKNYNFFIKIYSQTCDFLLRKRDSLTLSKQKQLNQLLIQFALQETIQEYNKANRGLEVLYQYNSGLLPNIDHNKIQFNQSEFNMYAILLLEYAAKITNPESILKKSHNPNKILQQLKQINSWQVKTLQRFPAFHQYNNFSQVASLYLDASPINDIVFHQDAIKISEYLVYDDSVILIKDDIRKNLSHGEKAKTYAFIAFLYLNMENPGPATIKRASIYLNKAFNNLQILFDSPSRHNKLEQMQFLKLIMSNLQGNHLKILNQATQGLVCELERRLKRNFTHLYESSKKPYFSFFGHDENQYYISSKAKDKLKKITEVRSKLNIAKSITEVEAVLNSSDIPERDHLASGPKNLSANLAEIAETISAIELMLIPQTPKHMQTGKVFKQKFAKNQGALLLRA